MSGDVPIDCWPERLERAMAERCTIFRRVQVVRETASTQDAARNLNASAGDVVVAWRQTAGRGRLGRRWEDTGEDGVAVTFIVPSGQPERLAIAGAIGVARSLESLLDADVGIKWPNDIVVLGRKLAGILIEQAQGCAFIGIGINVGQTRWPEILEPGVISLRQLGRRVDRIDVLCELIPALESALRLEAPSLVEGFVRRDVLRGKHAMFRHEGQLVCGIVQRIDPMRGLAVATQSGERWLPAATTTVLSTYATAPEWPVPSR